MQSLHPVRALAFSIGLLITAGIIVSGCSEGPKVESVVDAAPMKGPDYITVSDTAKKTMDIEIGQAQRRTLDMDVKTTGEVLANANLLTHVNSPVTGRVTDVLVSIGDRVVEGQPLLRVRSNDIEQAEADLLQNEAQVRADLKRDLLQIDSDRDTANAQLKLSESTFNRLKSLLDEQIASRADYETAKTQLEKDRIALASLERKRLATVALSTERMSLLTEPIKQKLRILGVTDSVVNSVLKTRRVDAEVPVLSPEAGIVSERTVNLGELIDPSKQLFVIGDFHSVWIKADVYEKDVSKVKCGQPITLELDSFPGEPFHGTLNYVADSISPDTRTLNVRAEVKNPELQLKPKMFARMKINVGEHSILSIPKTSIQDAGYGKVVYVPAGQGRFLEKKVELGSNIGDYVEILAGLSPGEPVVTRGSFALRSQVVKGNY